MEKMNAVEKWFIIRNSLLELQKKPTAAPIIKHQVKKSVKRKKGELNECL